MFRLTPQPAQMPFIPPWPPTEPAPSQTMPPMYPTILSSSMSSLSSLATSADGLPLPPFQPPFAAPPPVGQVYPPARPPPFQYPAPPVGQSYLPVGQPPVQYLAPYPLPPSPAAYPPAPWPPYPQAPWVLYPPYYPYQQGGNNEDSETARPDKFTGQDTSKLCPFIICCVIVFDSRPRKFATDIQ